MLVTVLWISWAVSVAVPIDFVIREGPKLSLRWIRVATVHNSQSEVRRFDDMGLTENRDFVVYQGFAGFSQVRYAVAFFVPVDFKIRTPLCGTRE
jgi:hypothetical protein